MADLSINFCGVKFYNPLILPSGIIQDIPDHMKAVDGGAGGITLKTLTPKPREGNPIPRVAKYDCGIINSVGFRNPGIEKGVTLAKDFIKKCRIPVIVSIFAGQPDEYEFMTKKAVLINPPLIEVNISCPNVTAEFGDPITKNKTKAVEVIKAVKKESKKIPVIVKLAADTAGVAQIAKACEEAGVDAICATNVIGPGMLIDIKTKKPILGNKFGGVSGPGIKPIAIKCIYDIYRLVKIPIIGMGGISRWEDVIEIMLAGATLVGIGTATYFKGMKLYDELKKGLREYMEKEGINDLTEIIGKAH